MPYPSVLGFNIGVNSGEAAGQTVMHCHVHLTPRRKGDTEDPRGGVRGVIPGRMMYPDHLKATPLTSGKWFLRSGCATCPRRTEPRG